MVASAIGIAMQFFDGLLDGFDGKGGWPQRVFIGGQFDGIGNAVFTLKFFKRLSGDIRFE